MTDSGAVSKDQKFNEKNAELAYQQDQLEKLNKVGVKDLGDAASLPIVRAVLKGKERIEIGDPDTNPFVSKSEICPDCCTIS